MSWPNCRLQCWCWENHYLFPHFLPKTWPPFFNFSIEPYVLFFIKWGWGDSRRICVQVPSWADELQLVHVRSTSRPPSAAAIFWCQGHKNNLHTLIVWRMQTYFLNSNVMVFTRKETSGPGRRIHASQWAWLAGPEQPHRLETKIPTSFGRLNVSQDLDSHIHFWYIYYDEVSVCLCVHLLVPPTCFGPPHMNPVCVKFKGRAGVLPPSLMVFLLLS